MIDTIMPLERIKLSRGPEDMAHMTVMVKRLKRILMVDMPSFFEIIAEMNALNMPKSQFSIIRSSRAYRISFVDTHFYFIFHMSTTHGFDFKLMSESRPDLECQIFRCMDYVLYAKDILTLFINIFEEPGVEPFSSDELENEIMDFLMDYTTLSELVDD